MGMHSPPYTMPDVTFDHIHIDLVGPLPPSIGYTYVLMCMDRFTKWREAVPIVDYTAATVAQAFLSIWITWFGVPSTVTTDHGSQFESELWNSLMKLLGTKHHTTSYNLMANRLVEHFHHQLKSALKAQHNFQHWVDSLPLIF